MEASRRPLLQPLPLHSRILPPSLHHPGNRRQDPGHHQEGGGWRGSMSLDLKTILFQHMSQLKMAGLKTQDKEQKVTQMVICLDALHLHCDYLN